MSSAKEILGALILNPVLLEAVELSAGDFPPGRERETFQAITALYEDRRDKITDLVLLADRLKGSENGAEAWIASLTKGNYAGTPDSFRARVANYKRKTITARIMKTIQAQAAAGDLDLEEIRPDLDAYVQLGRPTLNPGNALRLGSELQTLDLHISWLIDRLIPRNAVTMLHGPGGIGKTWILLQAAKAISQGADFLGLRTQERPVVFVALEDPLPILVERVRRLEISDVAFWCLGSEPKPPKLDAQEYVQYKDLPAGSLIIFDTLRSAHDGDENSSRDISLVMGRLKELRETGFDVVINHHTGKASDRVYKGSTAISDLSDHVLGLHKVRRGTLEEIDDDSGPGPDDFFRLGTAQKTRFEPFHVFLNFSPDGGFVLAQDPDEEELEAIRSFIRESPDLKTQSEVVEFVKRELGIGKKITALALLRKGERARKWTSYKDGRRRIYDAS